jgi:hypothetical protein
MKIPSSSHSLMSSFDVKTLMTDPRLIRFFGLLDLLILIRFYPRWGLLLSPLPVDFAGWFIALIILDRIFWVSLVFSGIGLLLLTQFSFVLSYIQFPLRFFSFLFSFGFITLLSRMFHSLTLYKALLIIAILLEIVKLVCIAGYHRKIRKKM